MVDRRVVVVGRLMRHPRGGAWLTLYGDPSFCGFERQTIVYPFDKRRREQNPKTAPRA